MMRHRQRGIELQKEMSVGRDSHCGETSCAGHVEVVAIRVDYQRAGRSNVAALVHPDKLTIRVERTA